MVMHDVTRDDIGHSKEAIRFLVKVYCRLPYCNIYVALSTYLNVVIVVIPGGKFVMFTYVPTGGLIHVHGLSQITPGTMVLL